MLTSLAPELNPNDQIQFAAFHRVVMPPGDYTLDAGQDLTIAGVRHWFPMATRNFSVLGERFELPPALIHAAFPPPASHGDFWRDLPHVILERSTLPWERTALRGENQDAKGDPPWLALLVFHGDEAPTRTTTKLSSLLDAAAGGKPRWPGMGRRGAKCDPSRLDPVEYAQHENDLVNVIDVPWRLLREQLPAWDLQTHCRRRLAILGSAASAEPQLLGTLRGLAAGLSPHAVMTAHDGKWHVRDLDAHVEYEIWKGEGQSFTFYRVASEKALLLGRRLPMPGKRNTIHLVSLEGRFNRDSRTFDAQGAGDGDAIRLVSLFDWEFRCDDPNRDFKGLLENLSGPAAFALPVPAGAKGKDAEQFLQAGFVPLAHKFREGSRSVSWYHGPLVPAEPAVAKLEPHPFAADELLLADAASGMFDVSYAAAWELGRMLTLRNSRIANRLHHWKRDHARSILAARRLADYGFDLPVHTSGGEAPTALLPPEVAQWLNELTLLCHVPFPYLVPDERLLPSESLRFFQLDRLWLECLRDGAYSIGRVLAKDADRDRDVKPAAPGIPIISGFLLRSELVSGFWESLRVKAYGVAPAGDVPRDSELDAKAFPPLSMLRMERLSPKVMLCLFADRRAEGKYGSRVVQMVDFHPKPEMLHFGFREKDSIPRELRRADAAATGYLMKPLRDAHGKETSTLATPEVSATRVVQLEALAKALGEDNDPARFALTMTAGVDLVRIRRK